MTRSVPVGEMRLLGDRALLLGVRNAPAAASLARRIVAVSVPGVREVVPGMTSVMVELEPGVFSTSPTLRTQLGEQMDLAEEAFARGEERVTGQLLTVPCCFDGPDLDEVAALSGCAPAEVIALLTAHPLSVAVVGFSPGFAYLDGLPRALRDIPRRATPRRAVPAGSVALANGHAAVYPTATPGGWQLVGRTDMAFFSGDAAPYARLAPGDRVQFTVASAADVQAAPPSEAGAAPWAPPPDAAQAFTVIEPGFRTVHQDSGRAGLAAIGIPSAAPGDPVSHALANRLVGNEPGADALECTVRGPRLRCQIATLVAVVGGRPDLTLDGQPLQPGKVFPVLPGQELMIGTVHQGTRTYVAVAGGLVAATAFGSVAGDQLAGLGSPPLVRGDALWAGTLRPPVGDHLREGTVTALPAEGPVTLRVLRGPHPEWFSPSWFDALGTQSFKASPASNRVGVRLQPSRSGAARIIDPHAGAMVRMELDSQGVVTGALQVPRDGHPVLLLPDHATLGGYPVGAVVIAADHGLLGQCAAGTEVRLVPVTNEEARQAWAEHERLQAAAVVGHYPLAVE